MKNKDSILNKIHHKLHGTVLNILRQRWKGYRILYPSYRHYLKNKGEAETGNKAIDKRFFYYTQQPHSGAGIGHQMANWISGYWYASKFEMHYAYSPFASKEWDHFLGFGENEVLTCDLCMNLGYKSVLLPPFFESNEEDMQALHHIFASYSGEKIVFCAEQDTSYYDQYGVMEDIKKKFNQASARKEDTLFFVPGHYNIAVHIRRGDIVDRNGNENLCLRWMDNKYYIKIIKAILGCASFSKVVDIYIFSQGKEEEFEEFEELENVHYCLETSARDSFLHMVRADMLITSKSSFSYKPALLSEGIRICPRNFWHGYPDTSNWILVDDEGNIEQEDLDKIRVILK